MKPITELTIGHIGKTIHVTDQDIDVTGTLYRIEAERVGPSFNYPGPWHKFALTIGGNRIRLGQAAQWEPA